MQDKNGTTAPPPSLPGDRVCGTISTLVAIVLTVFHLLVASPLLTLNNTTKAVVHGALVVTFFLLVKPMKRRRLSRVLDAVFIVITIVAAYEVIVMRNSNAASAVLYSPFQRYISIIFLVVAMIVAYRALGLILPTLSLLFLIYTLIGNQLPGMFATAKVTLPRMATYLMVGDEGLFGNALSTAANFIFLFVIFGSVLAFIGAGEFFVNISFAVFGRFCGGPAQAAVYSSMLMGMVNGSGAANVVTTGTFTIPLMKKTGFDPDTAGAVEACASNGGQIMPPVMGAVAFLMADATSLPYTTICLAALLPAVLYYLTISVSVFSYSHRNHIPVKAPDPDAPTVGQIFRGGWFYFTPILTLVVLMVMGFSTQRSALLTFQFVQVPARPSEEGQGHKGTADDRCHGADHREEGNLKDPRDVVVAQQLCVVQENEGDHQTGGRQLHSLKAGFPHVAPRNSDGGKYRQGHRRRDGRDHAVIQDEHMGGNDRHAQLHHGRGHQHRQHNVAGGGRQAHAQENTHKGGEDAHHQNMAAGQGGNQAGDTQAQAGDVDGAHNHTCDHTGDGDRHNGLGGVHAQLLQVFQGEFAPVSNQADDQTEHNGEVLLACALCLMLRDPLWLNGVGLAVGCGILVLAVCSGKKKGSVNT